MADYDDLLDRLRSLMGQIFVIPSPYQDSMLIPTIEYLTGIGKDNFEKIFHRDRRELSDQALLKRFSIEEICDSLLERHYLNEHDRGALEDLRALQAAVNAIYTYTLSQLGKEPATPPFAKWGRKADDLHICVKEDLSKDIPDINTGIVVLPLKYRVVGGALSWASLGHEIAGHGLLGVIPEIISELKTAIQQQPLLETPQENFFIKSGYWEKDKRLEELISDITAVLFGGLACAIGFIAHFRGLRGGNLSNTGDIKKEHPLDLLRAFAVIETMKLLKVESQWIEWLETECEKDLHELEYLTFLQASDSPAVFPDEGVVENGKKRSCFLFKKLPHKTSRSSQTDVMQDVRVSIACAKQATKNITRIIVTTKLRVLNDRSLINCAFWGDRDTQVVDIIKQSIGDRSERKLPRLPYENKAYVESASYSHLVDRKIKPLLLKKTKFEKIDKSLSPYLDVVIPFKMPIKIQKEPFYFRHIIAAAVQKSLESDCNINVIFKNMKSYLIDAEETID